MSRALAEAGYDDIPKDGLYVIGGPAVGAGDVPLGQLIRELQISKQSACPRRKGRHQARPPHARDVG